MPELPGLEPAAVRERLRARLRELEALFQVVPIGIAVAEDRACTVIRANAELARQLRIPPGRNVSKAGPEADSLPFRVYRDGREIEPDDLPMQVAARENREVRDDLLEIRHRGGWVIQLLCHAAPVRDGEGEPTGAAGAFVDVTESRRETLALAEARDRLALAQEAAGLGIWEWDLETETGRCSEEWFRLYGLEPREEITLAEWRERVPDAARVLADARLENAVDDRFAQEFEIVRPDGERRWLLVKGRSVEGPPGRAPRVRGVALDVTERKDLDEDLHRRHRQLDAVFNLTPVGLGLSEDPSCDHVRMNAFFARLVGLEETDNASLNAGNAASLPFRMLRGGQVLPPERLPLQRAARGERVRDEDLEMEVQDGRRLSLRCSAEPLRDESGRLQGSVGVFRDRTDELRKETALRRSLADLERFALVASHDLKEPLRTISTFAGLLDRSLGATLDEDGRGLLEAVKGGAQRLHALIDDMLAYVQVGGSLSTPRWCEAGDALRTALANLEGAVSGSGAVLSLPDAMPAVAMAESELAQVFQNLLANALKFAAPGRRPVIGVAAAPRPGGWEFSVSDNGIGIRPEHLGRIFDLFSRLHHRDEYAGTGLGLAICRKIVEERGGRIAVESVAGEGSVFRFTVPARAWAR